MISTPITTGLCGILIGCALTFTLMSYGQTAKDAKAKAREMQAVAEATQKARDGDHASAEVSAKLDTILAAQDARRAETERTIIKEVPHYVTANTDHAFALAMGLVRVRDAAASGDVSKLGGAPGVDNDSPSGIAPSAFASVLADDYAACRDSFDRLNGAQAYIKDQYALFHKPQGKQPVDENGKPPH